MSSYASYVTGAPDPSLSNISNPQVRGIVAHVLSLLPVPKTSAQIQQDVQSQVGAQTQPYLKELDTEATNRLTQGNNAITGYTNAAQDHLAGTDAIYKDIGSTDAQSRAAIMQAIQGGLQNVGGSVTSGLADRLRAINADPSFAADNAALAGNIAGRTASTAALGLEQSLGNTAANRGYAAALPGILGAAGLQSSRLLGEQVNADHQAGVDKITASLPALIASLTNSEQTLASNQASDRGKTATQVLENLLNLDTQRGIARQSFNLGLGKINASIFGTTTRANSAAAARAGKTGTAAAAARASTIKQINALVKDATALHSVKKLVPNTVAGQVVGPPISKTVTERTGKYGPTLSRANAIADALLGKYLPDDGAKGIDSLVASLVLPSLFGIKPPVKRGPNRASLTPGTR